MKLKKIFPNYGISKFFPCPCFSSFDVWVYLSIGRILEVRTLENVLIQYCSHMEIRVEKIS